MVRAKIKDASQAPGPGASVRVRVAVGTPLMATAVPASAVRKGPAGDHVFVVVADEHGKTRARLREVQVDAMSGDEAVITKGLLPGEQVAASGSFKLREAALVSVRNPTRIGCAQARPSPTRPACNSERSSSGNAHALIHRYFHQAPRAGGGGQPGHRAGRRSGVVQPAGAAVPQRRKLVGHHHHGLHRRQRRDRAWIPDHADRALGIGDQRRRLCRIDQSRGIEHRHGPAQARSQQHGCVG